jgi:hypothetical protein
LEVGASVRPRANSFPFLEKSVAKQRRNGPEREEKSGFIRMIDRRFYFPVALVGM